MGCSAEILTRVEERWRSPDLRMEVLANWALSGKETITRLVNVTLGEPASTIFLAPVGFSVVEEEESFTLTLRKQ